tara:strand:+ start:2609 stop:2782 length:174 start_codon:yes stop_codon:yes gene_type:complete
MKLPVIEVLEVTERANGTTRVVLDLDEEATSLLLSAGLEKILTDHVKEQERKHELEF